MHAEAALITKQTKRTYDLHFNGSYGSAVDFFPFETFSCRLGSLEAVQNSWSRGGDMIPATTNMIHTILYYSWYLVLQLC